MEITGKVDSGEKRLQMPGTFIKMKCPDCGHEDKLELVDQIYYPGDDDDNRCFAIECKKCEVEFDLPYRIEVFAKITI